MEYTINGANRETGRDVRFTVDADSEEDARGQAADMGILVAEVIPKFSPPAVVASTPPAKPTPHRYQQQYTAPPQPQAHLATTPRRSNSVGIVSFLLGVLALLLCWIPFVSVISVPISGLGLILAAVAFVLSLIRSGYGIGWPIGGGMISGIALFFGLVTGVGAFGVVKGVGDRLAAEQQQRTLAEAEPPVHQLGEWITKAPLHLRVDRVIVGRPALERYDESFSRTQQVRTVVYITVRNPEGMNKRTYLTLRSKLFDFDNRTAELTDAAGNTYAGISSGVYDYAGAAGDAASVYPGEQIRDIMTFEKPVESVDSLTLRLPLAGLEGDGVVKVRIPQQQIERIAEPAPPNA